MRAYVGYLGMFEQLHLHLDYLDSRKSIVSYESFDRPAPMHVLYVCVQLTASHLSLFLSLSLWAIPTSPLSQA